MASFREHEWVRLTAPVNDPDYGHFGTGTVGAIADLAAESALVEVIEADGRTAGLFWVPFTGLAQASRVRAA